MFVWHVTFTIHVRHTSQHLCPAVLSSCYISTGLLTCFHKLNLKERMPFHSSPYEGQQFLHFHFGSLPCLLNQAPCYITNFQNYSDAERVCGQSLTDEKTLGKRPCAREMGCPSGRHQAPAVREAFLDTHD